MLLTALASMDYSQEILLRQTSVTPLLMPSVSAKKEKKTKIEIPSHLVYGDVIQITWQTEDTSQYSLPHMYRLE